MFRLILFKRILKSIKTRYLGSKHERAPLSLHECLDSPPSKTGYKRSWFLVFLLAPLAYYLVVACIATTPVTHTNQMSEMEQEQHSFMSVPVSFNSVFLLRQESNITSRILPKKRKKNSSFLARIPARNEKIDFSNDTRKGSKKYQPVCPSVTRPVQGSYESDDYIFKQYNLTGVVYYRNQLSKGGYYESPLCRARHRIAVIVPYRNRERNLVVFLYVMHPFLIEQGLEYRIFVIEQSGREQFNRGRLLNVGYLEAKKHGNWECMVFHDVDLLPTTDRIKYSCPTWPRHMSAYVIGRPESENYKSHYGGVSVMTPSQFEKVNGYSNRYWGWGGEDTDMFWRIKHSGLALTRYSKSIAKYMALPHKQEPENPTRKKLLKIAMDEKSYKIDGLSNCHYKIVSKTMYHTYTHILVDINPNKTMSWE